MIARSLALENGAKTLSDNLNRFYPGDEVNRLSSSPLMIIIQPTPVTTQVSSVASMDTQLFDLQLVASLTQK